MAFGFFGGKKAAPAATPSATRPAAIKAGGVEAPDSLVSAKDADAAVETLAAVLRSLGIHAFDLGETDAPSIRRICERWAAHVLVAAPLEPPADDETPEAVRLASRRDWRALREAVSSDRRREATFVVQTLASLREVVWSFVAIVNRAAAADKQEGLVTRERLSRLRRALDSNDAQVLRHEASQTATLFEQALEEQGKRQSQQLKDFAASVRELGEELEGAKREGALDALTRLHNRACFDDFIQRTVELATLFKRPALLMMVDVDHFKGINDTFGHPAGDALLKAVGDALARTFPRRGDLVARYGGDEFAVVLKDAAPEDARVLARRMIEAARSICVAHQGREIRTTLSLGFAAYEDGDTPATWLMRADAALYAAKAAGRDGWKESPEPADRVA